MQRRFREIFEYQDQIKLPQAVLHSFQRSDFYVCQSDHQEWWVRKMDEAVRCRLQADTRPERYTFEGKFSEWDVEFQGLSKLFLKQ